MELNLWKLCKIEQNHHTNAKGPLKLEPFSSYLVLFVECVCVIGIYRFVWMGMQYNLWWKPYEPLKQGQIMKFDFFLRN